MTTVEPSPYDTGEAPPATPAPPGPRILPPPAPPATQPPPKARRGKKKYFAALVAVAAVVAVVVGVVIWAPWVNRVPGVPSAVRAADPQATSVVVRWEPATGGPRVDRYAILRDGVEVGTVPGTETSFLAQGLGPNTAFRFAVVAVAGDKRSDPSVEAAVTTLPAVPANVRAAAPDAVSVLVQWDPTAGGIDRYAILRDGAEVGSVAASETSFAIQGLRPGTAYRFAVVAVTGERRSDPSTEVSVTTSAPSPEALAADPAATTTDSIVFAWSPPPNSPAPDGYVITRNGQTIAKVTETSYTDTGLAPDSDYQYQVAAAWGDAVSPPTAVLAVRTVTPPVSDGRLSGSWPVDLTVTKSGGGSVDVGTAWTDTWQFTPSCEAGPCDVVITGNISPSGYASHDFTVTLTRDGASYAGTATAHITHCGFEPDVVAVDNTLTFTFTVETAGVSGNAWMARSLTGTLEISSPYTRLPSNFYCPAQSLNASLTASA